MLNEFKKIVLQNFNNFRENTVFLAISGGKDSMLLSFLLNHLNIQHHLLHCNFKLRGNESDQDELFVLKYAKKYNLKITTTQFDTLNYAEINKVTIQVAARELRYNWFEEQLKYSNNAVLLTAHHLDDAIETFFINLMRGTDLSGLSGIKNTSSIVRPLLNFTVEEIKKTIADYNIEYREDQSNATNKYLRNSLRNEIIPLLKSKTNGFEKKMETTMNRLENIDIWHNSIAEKFKTKYKLTGNLPQAIQISDLLSMPDFIIEKIFKKFEITRANSSAFINFLSSSSGSTFKANQFRFFHNRGTVIIDYNKSESNPIIHEIKKLPAKINTNNSLIEFVVKDEMLPYSPTIQQIDFSKVKMPITLRPWQFGDKIQPLGMSGTKLISDILINKKIPNHQKNSIQILQDSNNNILLIIGLVISEQFKITATTSKILKIKRSEFS